MRYKRPPTRQNGEYETRQYTARLRYFLLLFYSKNSRQSQPDACPLRPTTKLKTGQVEQVYLLKFRTPNKTNGRRVLGADGCMYTTVSRRGSEDCACLLFRTSGIAVASAVAGAVAGTAAAGILVGANSPYIRQGQGRRQKKSNRLKEGQTTGRREHQGRRVQWRRPMST